MKALWRQQLKMENSKLKLYLRPQKFVILVTKVLIIKKNYEIMHLEQMKTKAMTVVNPRIRLIELMT